MSRQLASAVVVLCAGLLLPTMGYAQADPDDVSVILKLEHDSIASYRGGVDGLDACSIAVTGGSRLDPSTPACLAYRAFLESKVDELEDALRDRIPEARIVHRLLVVFGGVSIILNEDRVEELLDLPGVVDVQEDKLHQLETARTPQFIGADRFWRELGGRDRAGEGVIVGVIDSGIWPESSSFSDPDPAGDAYPSPPLRWRGTACEFGSDTPGDEVFECNNKLIGADRVMDMYDATTALLPGEFPTARDDDGHGTHVQSTAVGNADAGAAIVFGEPLGVKSGVAPRSHAAAYRVFGAEGASISDITAAVQQAVEDGVDVINISASTGGLPYSNPLSLALLDAYEAGVVSSLSAGNSGPTSDSITSPEPWAIAVGNSTHDYVMAGTLEVTASNGDTLSLPGASLTGPAAGTIVLAADLGLLFESCVVPFPEGTSFTNEIVICARGGSPVTDKSKNVEAFGGSGVVMYNADGPTAFNELQMEKHFLPFIHIDFAAGEELLAFMESHEDTSAVLTQGEVTPVEDFPGGPPSLNNGTAGGADILNDGSSRGGAGNRLGISKPDITAPGTQILAGTTPLPRETTDTSPITEGAAGLNMIINGTSMAAPHVAGAAALLRDLHPDWTPGQIQSALMTTARQGLVKEDGMTPANPFERGSGRVDLGRAFEPGLTFVGPSAQDFRDHQNDLWNVNYPSLYLPAHPGRFTVERTVANELKGKKTWRIEVSAPPDVHIDVSEQVTIPKDGMATFEITVDAPAVPTGEVRHANLRLTHGNNEANFPISLVKSETGLPLTKSCEPTTFRRGDTTECSITASNTTLEPVAVRIHDRLPDQLQLNGDVDGATRLGPRELVFEGNLEGAVPNEVTVMEATSPFGYLPLASLDIEPLEDGVVGDETITNVAVPPFLYGGETYTRIGLVGNGFAVVGGGVVGLTPIPQAMPDPEEPNNVIAPLWTDLCGDGTFYVATVDPDDSGTEWLVLEWEDAVGCDGTDVYSFQIWIQVNTGEEAIFMVYGRVDGDGGDQFGFSVGAENRFGSSGETLTELPVVGRDLAVKTTPIIPGTHTITFAAEGVSGGNWENCAEMTSDVFAGTALACSEGEVR